MKDDRFGNFKQLTLFIDQMDDTGTESVYTVGTFDSSILESVVETPAVPLTTDAIKVGLRRIGYHPLLLKHAFLELVLSDLGLNDIDQLNLYPNIMFLDISNNKIDSLRVLSKLTTLVELKASHNHLKSCLNFAAPLCNASHAWREGHKAVGSLLTIADLSYNKIDRLPNLSEHLFLEQLLLSNNAINEINGLSGLSYLQVLDLSHNDLTAIKGLNNLVIRELKLQGNKIQSLAGLDQLPCLTYLDVSNNMISSLEPLRLCVHLTHLNASSNRIEFIRQTESLQSMPWLSHLLLSDNPCAQKYLYRLRVLYRLPNINLLDDTVAIPEEKIRAFNLYHSERGDLLLREEVLKKYVPGAVFVDYCPEQLPRDDEEDLTAQELSMGIRIKDIAQAEAIRLVENIIVQ